MACVGSKAGDLIDSKVVDMTSTQKREMAIQLARQLGEHLKESLLGCPNVSDERVKAVYTLTAGKSYS